MPLIFAAWSSVIVACSGGTASTTGPNPAPTVNASEPGPNTLSSRLFPLEDRHIYQYVTESDDGQGLLMTRVRRLDARNGELLTSGGAKAFEYANDGVILKRPGMQPVYVLKEPITVGQEWRGENGGTVQVVAVDAKVTVPAGPFEGCVKTLEERGGDRPMRVATTFCPNTGIVLLEVASGAAAERAALKSYGPPVDLGPDGVKKIPVSPDE